MQQVRAQEKCQTRKYQFSYPEECCQYKQRNVVAKVFVDLTKDGCLKVVFIKYFSLSYFLRILSGAEQLYIHFLHISQGKSQV